MSSEVQGVAMVDDVLIGIVAGAALPLVWTAFLGGTLVRRISSEIDEAIYQKRAQEEHELEVALEKRTKLQGTCRMLADELRSAISRCGNDVMRSKELSEALFAAEQIQAALDADGTGNVVAESTIYEGKMQQLLHFSRRLSRRVDEIDGEGVLDHADIVAQLSQLHTLFTQQGVGAPRSGAIYAVSPEEIERRSLRDELKERAVWIRASLLRERARGNMVPIKKEYENALRNIFSGIEKRIIPLLCEDAPIEEMRVNLSRIKDAGQRYALIRKQLDADESEFMTHYDVYRQMMEFFKREARPALHFSGLAELKGELESLKQAAAHAERCAKLYQRMGEDVYIGMALDIEAKRLGYSVVAHAEAQEYLRAGGEQASRNGAQLPMYQDGDALTQFYHLSEECCLQITVRSDGSTIMETFVASPPHQSAVVDIQRAHCEKVGVLQRALRQNWFVEADIAETRAPEQVQLRGVRTGRAHPVQQGKHVERKQERQN